MNEKKEGRRENNRATPCPKEASNQWSRIKGG
jgi:hypothetical protein